MAWMLMRKVRSHSSSLMSSNGFETCLVRGIVDEDVNAAERRERFVDDGAAVAWVLHVAADQEGLSARLLDPCLAFGGVFVFGQIRNEHVGTFPGIGDRNRPSDAAVAPVMTTFFPARRPEPLYVFSPWSGTGCMLA